MINIGVKYNGIFFDLLISVTSKPGMKSRKSLILYKIFHHSFLQVRTQEINWHLFANIERKL